MGFWVRARLTAAWGYPAALPDINGEDVPETATVLETIVESVARAWDSPRNHS